MAPDRVMSIRGGSHSEGIPGKSAVELPNPKTFLRKTAGLVKKRGAWIIGIIAALALLANNLDTLQTFWEKHFSAEDFSVSIVPRKPGAEVLLGEEIALNAFIQNRSKNAVSDLVVTRLRVNPQFVQVVAFEQKPLGLIKPGEVKEVPILLKAKKIGSTEVELVVDSVELGRRSAISRLTITQAEVGHETPQAPREQPAARLHPLKILSSPSEADIYIDGRFAGKTNRQVRLAEGSHEIRLTKEGYSECRRVIEVPRRSVLPCSLEVQSQ